MMVRFISTLLGVLCCAVAMADSVKIEALETPVYIASVAVPAAVVKPFFAGDVLDQRDLRDVQTRVHPNIVTVRFTGKSRDGYPEVAIKIVAPEPAAEPLLADKPAPAIPSKPNQQKSNLEKPVATNPVEKPSGTREQAEPKATVPPPAEPLLSPTGPNPPLVPFATPLPDEPVPEPTGEAAPAPNVSVPPIKDDAATTPVATASATASLAGWRVKAIAFEGNDVSRRSFLLDELRLKEGDTVDGAKLDGLRQSLMNTGLYREVEWKTTPPNADLGSDVVVTFVLDEPFYFFGYPEVSVNTDRETSLGLVFRGRNLFGMNHSLNVRARRKNLADADKGAQTSISAGYGIPKLLGSNWGGAVSYSRSITENRPEGAANYDEGTERLSVGASRQYRFVNPNQRLRVGASTGFWRYAGEPEEGEQQDVASPFIGASVGYRDMKFLRYSELGSQASVSVETSLPGGDFDYQRVSAGTKWLLPGFDARHSNWVLSASLGLFEGGPRAGYEPYSLSSSNLRGVKKGEQNGNVVYGLSAEYRTPVFGWDNVRAYGFVDVAEVSEDIDDVCFCDPQMSIGLGIRWRVEWFVDLEIGVGIAYHLDEGSTRVLFDSGKFK